MKNLKIFIVVIMVVLMGTQCKQPGGDTSTSNPPPVTKPAPAPAPKPVDTIVKVPTPTPIPAASDTPPHSVYEDTIPSVKPAPAPKPVDTVKAPVPVPTPKPKPPTPVPQPQPKPVDTPVIKPQPAPIPPVKDTIPLPYPRPLPIDTCDCSDTAIVFPPPPKPVPIPPIKDTTPIKPKPSPKPDTTPVTKPPVITPPVKAKAAIGMLPYNDAESMGLTFGRTRIVVQNGNGMQTISKASKVLYLPSIVWDSTGKTFPLDLALYEKKLQALANVWDAKKAPWVVIENEPSFNETNGEVARYIAMMKIAIKVFKTKGVEVFIGGMTYPAVETYCYQLYLKEGDTKSAKVFKDNGGAGANKDALAFVAGYMDHINDVGLNANFNFHIHCDPGPMATLPLVLAKLKQIVKGKIIAGEVGFGTQSADVVTATMNAMKDIDGIIFYNGKNGPGADNDVAFTPEMIKAMNAFK